MSETAVLLSREDYKKRPLVPSHLKLASHLTGSFPAQGADLSRVELWSPPYGARAEIETVVKGLNHVLSCHKEQKEPIITLNANALDFLLANPHQIPGQCKGKHTYFLATQYKDESHHIQVRYLYNMGGDWFAGDSIGISGPIALLRLTSSTKPIRPAIRGCPKCSRWMCDHTEADMGWSLERFDAYYFGHASVKAYREFLAAHLGISVEEVVRQARQLAHDRKKAMQKERSGYWR